MEVTSSIRGIPNRRFFMGNICGGCVTKKTDLGFNEILSGRRWDGWSQISMEVIKVMMSDGLGY